MRTFASMFAVHDLLLAAYILLVAALVWRAGAGDAQAHCARRLFACLAALVLGCAVCRLDTALPARARSAMYRVVSVGVVVENYLVLRRLLPIVQPHTFDAALHSIDLALVGVAPTLLLEPFTTSAVVEYFAFFYFSYFWLCFAYVVVAMAVMKSDGGAAEFAIGTALVYCVGQLGYVAVPAYGPLHHLSAAYAGPLQAGFFWRCVVATVSAASALKDVFPSLHTAGPVWFSLFAARRARVTGSRSWALAAAVTAFFALQIVASTVVLRWHYLADVGAGLALAAFAAWVAPRLATAEQRLRERAGWRPAWSFV